MGGWIYVPKDKDLRDEVIHLHHDTYVAGHPGRFKTAELVLRNYWWPRIHGDIREYAPGANRQRCSPRNPEANCPQTKSQNRSGSLSQ